MAATFRVVLDACVILPQNLNNLLLTLASHDMFTPVWTPDLLDEVQRNLLKSKFGLTRAQAEHRLTQMRRAFPHAEDHAIGYAQLVRAMKNHRKDRHVLAAAVASGAALIVTNNLRDFPDAACSPHDVEAVSPDEFLLDQLDLDSGTVLAAMAALAKRNQRPPRTVLDLAEALRPLTPRFTAAVIDTIQPAVALELVDETEMAKHFPEKTVDEIMRSPLAVAQAWRSSLSHRDTYPQVTTNLTVAGEEWDFDAAARSLEGYGLTTGVHNHTGRDDVVYLKFIRAGNRSARAFAEFTTDDFRVLALQRGHDGYWRVHSLIVDGWPQNAVRESRPS